MKLRNKYQLPIIAHLKHIDIDLKQLQKQTSLLSDKFIDVRSANPALCDNHMELAERVYDNFTQLNLTVHEGKTMEYTDSIKKRIQRKEERLYNKPTPEFEGSYFQEIVQQFKAPAMRVRITKLAPQKNIPLHIDYNPTYATRIIIPIYSNPNVKNIFKVKNQLHEFYLEPGKAYFFNTGFKHGLINKSSSDRVAFMFSLDGQKDLEFI